MEITRLLEKEHREVDDLFTQMKKATSETEMNGFYEELYFSLWAHMEGEEKIFYPRVKQLSEAKGLINHSEEEHSEIKQLLEKVRGMRAGSGEWVAGVEELKQQVEHHVGEEEKTIFPKVRECFQANELETLALEYDDHKGAPRPIGQVAS